MKIAAGNSPPVITSATPNRESISPSWNIITKIGTIAAVPVTTEDSSSNPYNSASRPGIRTRDNAYDASAANAVTATAVVTQISSELTIECIAYGCSRVLRTFSSVQSGQRTPSPGFLSNGADAIHRMGTAE